jgi:phosphatidylglycerol---prolipoprotein diacylglyceryl transferase
MPLPHVHLDTIEIGPLPIQPFGLIVGFGVFVGAALLRRYAVWHGVDDARIRSLLTWVIVTGFLGAHLFNVLAYQWDELQHDPLLLVKFWASISSFGGFLGGAMGFAYYTWRHRLDRRLFADITLVGLLPAFTIGRIGCTVVNDHVGRAADPSAWYSALAMNYPHGAAWNLGLIEFLYLVPINVLILWLAFRKKRMPAGFVTALTGVLYAPVRFFLDFLRLESTDVRHLGLTFAQWCSLLAFGAALYLAMRIVRNGTPASLVRPLDSLSERRPDTGHARE